jgi:hypothetical protein
MTQQEALKTLIDSVFTAQRRGAFNLEEASTIWEACQLFTAPPSPALSVPDESANDESGV